MTEMASGESRIRGGGREAKSAHHLARGGPHAPSGSPSLRRRERESAFVTSSETPRTGREGESRAAARRSPAGRSRRWGQPSPTGQSPLPLCRGEILPS